MPSALNTLTLSGNVVGMPRRNEKNPDLVSFRIASTGTYWSDGAWREKPTVYIDVQCWKRLGENVLGSVMTGMPVVVTGELTCFEYQPESGPTDRDGQVYRQQIYRLKSKSVGLDLNWAKVKEWARRSSDRETKVTPAAGGGADGSGPATAAESTVRAGAAPTEDRELLSTVTGGEEAPF